MGTSVVSARTCATTEIPALTPHTIPQTVLFPDLLDKPLVALRSAAHQLRRRFVLFKAAEKVYGLVDGFVRCLVDRREPGKVRHTLADLLGQRIFGIACGHPDGKVAGCRRGLGDAVRVRFGRCLRAACPPGWPRSRGRRPGAFRDLPSRPTSCMIPRSWTGAMPAMRRRARRFTSFARTDTAVPREGGGRCSKRQGIGICTLCAPYASKRHGSRTRLVLVSIGIIRSKAGAGERTRTADLLIAKQLTELDREEHRLLDVCRQAGLGETRSPA